MLYGVDCLSVLVGCKLLQNFYLYTYVFVSFCVNV